MAGISGFANTLNLVDDTGGTVTSIAAGTGITLTPDPIVATGTVALTIPVVVSSGGTGRITLTNHGVLIGAGTSAITQLAAAAGGTVLGGVAASDPAFTATPVLGIAGTTLGSLGFSGNTSGVVSILPQAAAGTYNFNLPTTAGSSGQFLTSGGGVGAPMTWSSLTVPGSTTQVIFNDAGAFGADAGLTYDKTTDTLAVVGSVLIGTGGTLSSFAAATLRIGAADAASPTAQNVSTQNVVAGTSNTAGVNLTFKGSIGTGTGAGGSFLFQVAAAGTTGTSQNTLATALTIDSTKMATFTGSISAVAGTFSSNVTGLNLYAAAAGFIQWSGRAAISSAADGVIRISNDAANDFGRLQFGGTTSSFPSLKRSTTILQARLADDSAFAPLQGMLRTDTNATTGLGAGVLAALTNASLTLYDASGQAYRVPAII